MRFKKLFSKRWRKNGRQEFIFPFPGKLKLIQLKYFKFTTENPENGELKIEEDKNKYRWTLNNERVMGTDPPQSQKFVYNLQAAPYIYMDRSCACSNCIS